MANLASLLTDAEMLSSPSKNVGSGLSSITLSAKHISLPSKKSINTDVGANHQQNLGELLLRDNSTEQREGPIKENIRKSQEESKDHETATPEGSNKNPSSLTFKESNKISETGSQNEQNKNQKNNTTNEVAKNGMKKGDVPNIEDIKQAFQKGADKDFAPIFAMYHGKIVPLGKLPDNSFKKSHTEEPEEPNPKPVPVKDVTGSKPVPVKDVTGSKRTFTDTNNKKSNTYSSRYSKLQEYLTNLEDEHSSPANAESSVKGVPKDEVVFPEDENPIQKSDLLSHVKGVVLDSGKVVSVNNNKIDVPVDETSKETNSETTTTSDSQKFYVSEDGTLNPLTKAKDLTGESVARDTTSSKENPDGQKTVAISLDVLKDLLKKTDTKISLASLLNKSGETKSEPSQPSEDEDPGRS